MISKIKKVETIQEFIDAIRLRIDVFIIEQKCPPGFEPDVSDKQAEHFIALYGTTVVATARLRKKDDITAKMERMVVAKTERKKGIGSALLQFIIAYTKRLGYKKLFIQAQVRAVPFYQDAGFHVVSEAYDLWNLGIPHVDMEYLYETGIESTL